ncbi:hypothetical protein FRC07_006899 [Ceratobasidium sp. 392]|nr:hypothetical protein FRC07_006899 [Ceratobasidium sp. 392]
MPATSGSNPSTVLQAQKAQGDAIDDLKRKYSQITETLSKLEETLDKVKKNGKSLAKKVQDLEGEREELATRLDESLEQQSHLQRFRTKATRLLRALAAGQTFDEVHNQIVADAISFGDPNAYFLALERLGDDGDSDEDEGSGQNSQTGDGNHVPGTTGTADLPQEEILESRLFMKAVNSCLFHLMGAVSYLKAEHEMVYPEGLTPQDENWPSEGVGAARRPLLRFDFTKRHDDPINVDSFKQWCTFVRERGAQRVPKAESILAQATEDTIKQRCAIKYQYEADKYKRSIKTQLQALDNAQHEQEQGDGGSGGDTADDGVQRRVPDAKKKRTAAYRARSSGKMKSRERRMALLPADQYTEMQRATMLTPGAQSQDETEYEVGEDGARRKTKRFTTRAWPFLSDTFVAMKQAIDAIADPSPERGYQTRVPGPPREGDPPRNKMNEHCLREWMIKPDVLAAHPEWTRTRRVIPDGDPIKSEKPAKRRRSDNSSREPLPANQLRNVRQKLMGARTALENTLAGATYDQLQEDLVADGDDEGAGVPSGDSDDDGSGGDD